MGTTRASLLPTVLLFQSLCEKMRALLTWLVGAFLGAVLTQAAAVQDRAPKTCTLKPLGHGKDDTDQVSFDLGILSSNLIKRCTIPRWWLQLPDAGTSARQCSVQANTILPGSFAPTHSEPQGFVTEQATGK